MMRRRDFSMALLASSTGSGLVACDGTAVLISPPAQAQTPAQPGSPTQAEVAAGVTPVDYQYPEGCVNRYGENPAPGMTDMTAAIKAACAVARSGSSLALTFLGQQYLVTDTAITLVAADTRMVIQGVALKTVLLNKAPPDRPTIRLLGAQYFELSGLVLVGASGFPNIGLELAGDNNGNRCAFGVIRRLVCQTNGGGIHIQDTNTVAIEDYSYWPSGGASFGGTIDTNGQPYGILADGTSAVNSIYLTNINISGVNPMAAGGCGIKIDGSNSSGYFQDWRIDGLGCERSGTRSLWLRNAYLGRMQNVFVENTEVRVDQNCTLCEICFWGGAVTTLIIDGTQPLGGCAKLYIHDCIGKSITADAANQEIMQINNYWQVAPGNADSSTNRTQVNCRTTGGTLQPDVVGALGIKERNRSVAIGEWTTPDFSPGYFSASGAMTWTVAAANVATYEWTIVGKMMTVSWYISGTLVSGPPSYALFIAIPGGFTAAKRMRGSCEVLNNAVYSLSTAEVLPGAAAISVYKDPGAQSVFGPGFTDTYGQMTFEVR